MDEASDSDSAWDTGQYLIRDHDTVGHHPQKPAELRRLLKNSRGEADGAIRHVTIDYESCPDNKPGEHLPLVGPRDGRPIYLELNSGLPMLRVESGKAIILADSSWGNSITVAAGAEAIVIADPGIKVTCDVEEGGKLTIMTDSQDNRTFSYGAGEIITIYAQDEALPQVSAADMSAPYEPDDHDKRWEDSKRFLRAQSGKTAQELHDKAIREDNAIGFSRSADVRAGQAKVIEKIRQLAAEQ